jgi:hypothetical protein
MTSHVLDHTQDWYVKSRCKTAIGSPLFAWIYRESYHQIETLEFNLKEHDRTLPRRSVRSW